MKKTDKDERASERAHARIRAALLGRSRDKLKRIRLSIMKAAWEAVERTAKAKHSTGDEVVEQVLLGSPAMASNAPRLLASLTPFTLMRMSPGSSIDPLLARMVMKYKGHLIDDGSLLGDWTYAEAHRFRPSIEISDAMRLIERLAPLKPNIELLEVPDFETEQTKLDWVVKLTSREDEDETVTDIAATLPLAIARSAVKALARGFLSPAVDRRLADASRRSAAELQRITAVAKRWLRIGPKRLTKAK